MIAQPYTARQCPLCLEWIYCADGPFAEGDPTKTLADYEHVVSRHPEQLEPIGPRVTGFPYFRWNDEPVTIRDYDPERDDFPTETDTPADYEGDRYAGGVR